MTFIQKALDIFSSVEDDSSGANVIPMPPHILDGILTKPELVHKYDHMLVSERLAYLEKEGLLDNEQLAYVVSTVELFFGARLEICSMLGWLRWWALCGHSYQGCFDLLQTYKIGKGQSHLAR